MDRQIVLIGGGQTSASAASSLRREGYEGRIILVGDEPHNPYQRPPLSKEYLLGTADHADIQSLTEDWYRKNDVCLELGKRARCIDKQTLTVELDGGRTVRADAVLIATGGSARRFPGSAGDSILYLRTLEDADRIRDAAAAGKRLIIVGGGFIGSEIAASARALGADVTLVEAMETPFERVLGKQIGRICGDIHAERGVKLRCGVAVTSIRQSGAEIIVETDNGERYAGDAVVVGIGIAPNVDIAKASEITVGNGIRVDEFCRTTDNGIFAAGDVANFYHPLLGCRMRIEHFNNASRQGAVAARNMLGKRTEYKEIPWFWSDQYEHSLQYVGHSPTWDRLVIRGSIDERDFTAFYLSDGRIGGAFAFNRGGEIAMVKELIAARVDVHVDMLEDEDVDLGELIPDEGETGTAGSTFDNARGSSVDETFTKVARSGQVREGEVRRFQAEGVEIAVARVEGVVYAVHNLCTHLACHLAAGKIANGGLTCLCHGSVFDLRTGEPINPPATRAVRTYAAAETDGFIYIRLDG